MSYLTNTTSPSSSYGAAQAPEATVQSVQDCLSQLTGTFSEMSALLDALENKVNGPLPRAVEDNRLGKGEVERYPGLMQHAANNCETAYHLLSRLQQIFARL